MEPVFYLLAVLGCGDGQTACEQVRVEPARFATVASCRAATAPALMRSTDLPFPVITAECRSSKTQAAVRTGPAEAVAPIQG